MEMNNHLERLWLYNNLIPISVRLYSRIARLIVTIYYNCSELTLRCNESIGSYSEERMHTWWWTRGTIQPLDECAQLRPSIAPDYVHHEQLVCRHRSDDLSVAHAWRSDAYQLRMRDTIDFVPRCRVNVVCFMYVVRSPYGMTRSCYEVILPLHVVCVPVSFVMGGSISHYYIVSDTIYCEWYHILWVLVFIRACKALHLRFVFWEKFRLKLPRGCAPRSVWESASHWDNSACRYRIGRPLITHAKRE